VRSLRRNIEIKKRKRGRRESKRNSLGRKKKTSKRDS
jgi:hypothetical protein